jgi:hypothetical protein
MRRGRDGSQKRHGFQGFFKSFLMREIRGVFDLEIV